MSYSNIIELQRVIDFCTRNDIQFINDNNKFTIKIVNCEFSNQTDFDIIGKDKNYLDIDPDSFFRKINRMQKELNDKINANNISIPSVFSFNSNGETLEEEVYVSVYTTTRHFGGKEEGGWWYNFSKLEKSIPTFSNDERSLKMLCERLRNWAANKELKWGNIYSVNGGQDCFIVIENIPGSLEDKRIPNYD